MKSTGGRPPTSLLSVPAVVFVAGGALLAMWPLVFKGGTFWFGDSAWYIMDGFDFWRPILATLGLGPDVAEAGPPLGSHRSLPYSIFIGLPMSLGLRAPTATYMQTCLVLALVWPFVARLRILPRRELAAAAAVMLLATPLPFFAVFLVPDILAAAVILYGMLLAGEWDALDLPTRAATTAIAVFVVTTHHGNLPLAAAVLAAALCVRWWRGRLATRTVALGAATLAAAAMVNVAVGVLAFDRPSLAPKRLPILLARSIEDGPALWYLEEACAEIDYTVCTFWEDGIPGSVGTFLWNKGEGLAHADPEILDAVRAEEFQILWRAFRAYPVRQVQSLAGNAARQLVTVGTRDLRFGVTGIRATLLEAMGKVHLASYLAGAVLLALLVWRSPQAGGAVVVLAAGLLANAAIFGGLSAPVDRYQARVAWLVPLLALVLLLERRTGARAA